MNQLGFEDLEMAFSSYLAWAWVMIGWVMVVFWLVGLAFFQET